MSASHLDPVLGAMNGGPHALPATIGVTSLTWVKSCGHDCILSYGPDGAAVLVHELLAAPLLSSQVSQGEAGLGAHGEAGKARSAVAGIAWCGRQGLAGVSGSGKDRAAWPGKAGMAWRTEAWRGSQGAARQGRAWQAWLGVVRRGWCWLGQAGEVGHRKSRQGMAW